MPLLRRYETGRRLKGLRTGALGTSRYYGSRTPV